MSGLGGLEMLSKPVSREYRYLLQGAGLFEQVGGALNDFNSVFGSRGQFLDGSVIEIQNHRILCADDEQRWRNHCR